jgi:hypothetical protein
MKSKIRVLNNGKEAKPALRNSCSLLLTRCYRTRTTADKREIKDFPKLPSATSFIREMLDNIGQ